MEINLDNCGKAKVSIDEVDIGSNYIDISWASLQLGFGHVILYKSSDGDFYIDDEYMGEDFCKALFNELVSNAFNN